MSLPGKHMEQLRLAPSQMLPRNQLKKPLLDILRDISKRSKATVDMRGGPGGSIIFEGKGSVNSVREALKDVAQQVGSKVCLFFKLYSKLSNSFTKQNTFLLANRSRAHPHVRSSSHYRFEGCRGAGYPTTYGCSCAGSPG